MSLFAFFALGVLAGCAVARAFEMHIPLSSRSTAAQHEFLLITREIGNWNRRLPIANCRLLRSRRWVFFLFRQPNNRPYRNLYDFVRARAAAHFFSHPVPAVFRLDQGFVEKIGKMIDVPVRPQDHVTTAPTIAAVGPAFRHKFFTSETDAPAPASSRLCKNVYPIDEHGSAALHRQLRYIVEASNRHRETLRRSNSSMSRTVSLSSLQLQSN